MRQRIVCVAIAFNLLGILFRVESALPGQARAAIEGEIQTALEEMRIEASRGRYPNYASGFRDLESRIHAIYSRHGLQADPFDQAYLSYSVALAGRVDRKEISIDEAKSLMDKMNADMQFERQRLALQYQAVQGCRSAEGLLP